MDKRKHKNNKGFTLVELLAVIVIISILAVVVAVAINHYIDKGKDEYNKGMVSQTELIAKSFYPDKKNRVPVQEGASDYVTLKELATLNYLKNKVVDADDRNCMDESYVAVEMTDKGLDYTACLICGKGEDKKSYLEDREKCNIVYEEIKEKELSCEIKKYNNTEITLTIGPETLNGNDIKDRVAEVLYYKNDSKQAASLGQVEEQITTHKLDYGKYRFQIVDKVTNEQISCGDPVTLEEPKIETSKLQCVSVTGTPNSDGTKQTVNITVNKGFENSVSNVTVYDEKGNVHSNLGAKLTGIELSYGTYSFELTSNTSDKVKCTDKANLTLPGISAIAYYMTQAEYNTYSASGLLSNTILSSKPKYDGSWKNGYVYVVINNPQHYESITQTINNVTKQVTNKYFWVSLQGDYATTIKAIGKDKIEKSASVRTKLNRAAPIITLKNTNPTPDNYVNKNITVTATIEDLSPGIDKVSISYDNSTWTDITSFTTNTSTKKVWTKTYEASQNSTVYIKATDKVGNVSTVYSTKVRINKTAPTIVLTNSNPTPNNFTNKDIKLEATIKDETPGIDKVYYSYDKSTWTATTNFTTNTTTQKVWTSTFQSSQDKVLYLKATDKAGNTSTIYSTKIRIDKTAPGLTYINSSNSNWTKNAVTITATGTDSGSGIKENSMGYYHRDYDTENKKWGDWTTSRAVSYWGSTTNTTSSGIITKQVVTKEYSAERFRETKIEVCDVAGNCNTTIVTKIKIDKTAPEITLTNSSNGNWTNKDITVKVTAQEEYMYSGIDKATLKYRWKDSGESYGDYLSQSNWSDSLTNTNSTVSWATDIVIKSVAVKKYSGLNTNRVFQARVCDKAGNCATTSGTSIKQDVTIPTCASASYVGKNDSGNRVYRYTFKDNLSGVAKERHGHCYAYIKGVNTLDPASWCETKGTNTRITELRNDGTWHVSSFGSGSCNSDYTSCTKDYNFKYSTGTVYILFDVQDKAGNLAKCKKASTPEPNTYTHSW